MWYAFNLDISPFPLLNQVPKLSFWDSLLQVAICNNAMLQEWELILSDGVAAVIRYDPHSSILPCSDVLYWR